MDHGFFELRNSFLLLTLVFDPRGERGLPLGFWDSPFSIHADRAINEGDFDDQQALEELRIGEREKHGNIGFYEV